MKTALLCTTALAGAAVLLAAPNAFAQDQATSAPHAEPSVVQEIVVTGTRLKLPEYELSNPVVTTTATDIQRSGQTNLVYLLQQTPALVGSLDSSNTDAGLVTQAGLNLLNLRNLGTQRTLVLVDGRRHVASDFGTASVDTNTIPEALVDRVEVLTGGASAIYGADGVTGVVNFVMKTNFDGLDMRAQTGWTQDGGGAEHNVSVLYGKNFAGGRGNIALSGEFNHTGAIYIEDRKYSSLAGTETLIDNPADPTDDPAIPDKIFAKNVRYIDTSPGGSVFTGVGGNETSLGGYNFTGDGQPFVDGVYGGTFLAVGGSGTLLSAYSPQLQPRQNRSVLNMAAHYDLTPRLTVFTEAKWAHSATEFSSQPSFDYSVFVPIDNPYIPASIFDAAMTPGGTGTTDDGVYYGRDNFDLGVIRSMNSRNTWRFVGGLKGSLTDDVDFEASYNWGQTRETDVIHNIRNNERYFAAVDAVTDPGTGNIVCRSDLDPTAAPFGDGSLDPATFGTTFTPGPGSGCTPIDIFGEGHITQAQRDWINTTLIRRDKLQQQVANGYLSGRSTPLFELPAGPVSWVLGFEYRKESASSQPDPLELLADSLGEDITWYGQSKAEGGSFNVKEVFGELSIPVLKDLPFVKRLTIDGAYRYSDYSTSGGNSTYKIGANWNVSNSLMLRGTYAHAVRAPNITELFEPNVQTFQLLSDPCDISNVTAGKAPREGNCMAALTALGVDPSTFINTTSAAVQGRIGGNADLQPETARTITGGIVLTPTAVPGLSMSFDYYDIKLTDAIEFFEAQDILDYCYDLPQPNDFCSLIHRDPSNGFVDSFQQIGVNVSRYITNGVDMTLRYHFDPARFGIERDIGQFDISLIGNRLYKLTFVQLATADPDPEAGSADNRAPKWQANFDLAWTYNRFTVNYGLQWFSKTRRFTLERMAAEPDYVTPDLFYYPSRHTQDIRVEYAPRDGVSIYGGVNNITNQTPGVGSTAFDFPVSPIGRYFFMGVKYTM